jgi:periplasmic divalent cation tolerance protein
MSDYVIVITTVDSEASGKQLCRQLVEEKLVACAHITSPVTSVYHWEGKIQEATEWACELKTSAKLASEVEKRIKELHSYSVPQIVTLPIDTVEENYGNWLTAELK